MPEFIMRMAYFIAGWGLGFIALLACYLGWQLYRGPRP